MVLIFVFLLIIILYIIESLPFKKFDIRIRKVYYASFFSDYKNYYYTIDYSNYVLIKIWFNLGHKFRNGYLFGNAKENAKNTALKFKCFNDVKNYLNK